MGVPGDIGALDLHGGNGGREGRRKRVTPLGEFTRTRVFKEFDLVAECIDLSFQIITLPPEVVSVTRDVLKLVFETSYFDL